MSIIIENEQMHKYRKQTHEHTSKNEKTFQKNEHSIKQTLVDFKNTYCPDGQQCNDIATVSSLVFVIWFMYVAMEPLFTY